MFRDMAAAANAQVQATASLQLTLNAIGAQIAGYRGEFRRASASAGLTDEDLSEHEKDEREWVGVGPSPVSWTKYLGYDPREAPPNAASFSLLQARLALAEEELREQEKELKKLRSKKRSRDEGSEEPEGPQTKKPRTRSVSGAPTEGEGSGLTNEEKEVEEGVEEEEDEEETGGAGPSPEV